MLPVISVIEIGENHEAVIERILLRNGNLNRNKRDAIQHHSAC